MRIASNSVLRPLGAAAPQPLKAATGSNHVILVKNSARCTFVTFNTDAPSVSETSASGPANIVRLNDSEGGFAKGVPGFLGSLDEVFCWLRGLAKETPLKFVGEGNGASTALLAGMLIPDAMVLAVNPSFNKTSPAHPFWSKAEAIAANLSARQGIVTVLSCWDPPPPAYWARKSPSLPPSAR